jgi:hypothetical protein
MRTAVTRTRRVGVAVALATAALLVAGVAQPAGAQLQQSGPVSANPADWTPRLPNLTANTATYAFTQFNGIMYAGGQFTQVNSSPRTNLVAFNATNGALLASFAPTFDGAVWGLAADATGLYVGGEFTTVNGVPHRGIAKLDLTTGALITTFASTLNGNVYDVHLSCGRLYVGGRFTRKLATLDTTTGAQTSYANLGISGTVAANAGPVGIYRFAINEHAAVPCTRLVAIGNFTTVAGQARSRAFMADLGATSATLDSWYYQPLTHMCQATSLPAYLRGVDFAPDGSYFVLAGTGFVSMAGDLGSTVCDAAARFETSVPNPAKPTWINYTGGDTLHSVAVTGSTVYVAGHLRWLDNTNGRNSAGPGAVSRQGIGAIDPTTGLATTWNPGRVRGVGAKVLYATSAGLWVGSDTGSGGQLGCSTPMGPNHDDCTGQKIEVHPGIGFLPLP